jgi:luciferase family oxidoreductase group 1
MRLSLLDRSRTRAGHPDGQALHDTLARARRAEELGLHRFWVAEHHAVPGIASGAPAVLLAALGQATQRIRLGSGGVMLPQHQPLVVAEQFRMLEALHPGRIDLGAGRSLGFTAPVRRALRREAASAADFEADLAELGGYLTDAGALTARPVTGPIPLHVLATGAGMGIAARLGLPVVVGGPMVLSDDMPEALAVYRREFRADSSPFSDSAPRVIVSLEVFVAETADRAEELALPEAWAMARSRELGAFPPLEPASAIRARTWQDRTRRRVEEQRALAVSGTRATVATRLHDLAAAAQADEIMATTSTYDREDLAELDEAFAGLAEELG